MTYGVISDTHYHSFTQFATTSMEGMNSRLELIINATLEAAHAVLAAGGNTLYHGGDMFHVRGSLAPSVLNPVVSCYKRIIQDMGLKVYVIAGNHDLESKDSRWLTNASSNLTEVGVHVVDDYHINQEDKVVLVAWRDKTSQLIHDINQVIAKIAELGESHTVYSLMIHAPVNGVIYGIPDHGLDAKTLSNLGFTRVFSGHYHNHKDLGNGVFSIGALTHQTWNDVNSKAGYLLVSNEAVEHRETSAPKFLDLDNLKDVEEADGHFVRCKVIIEDDAEIEGLRSIVEGAGAKGVVIMPQRVEKKTERDSKTTKIDSLRESIGAYCEGMKAAGEEIDDAAELFKLCEEILTEAESA